MECVANQAHAQQRCNGARHGEHWQGARAEGGEQHPRKAGEQQSEKMPGWGCEQALDNHRIESAGGTAVELLAHVDPGHHPGRKQIARRAMLTIAPGSLDKASNMVRVSP